MYVNNCRFLDIPTRSILIDKLPPFGSQTGCSLNGLVPCTMGATCEQKPDSYNPLNCYGLLPPELVRERPSSSNVNLLYLIVPNFFHGLYFRNQRIYFNFKKCFGHIVALHVHRHLTRAAHSHEQEA